MSSLSEIEIEQVGRPSKVNEVDLDVLCSELQQGSTIKLACARVGISERTYSRWRLLGMQDEEPFIIFYQRTELARAKAMDNLLEVVYNRAMSDPKVAMWLLERIYPDEFSLNPHFRVDKFDRAKQEFQEQPIKFSISYGDDDDRFENAVKRQELSKFLNILKYTEEFDIDLSALPYDKIEEMYEEWLNES
jgi:hypothetical protein